MPDSLYQAHDAIRRQEDWKEWTDGVDAEFLEVRNGITCVNPGGPKKLRSDKDGTITWFLYDAVLATGVHAATLELEGNQTDLNSPAIAQGANLGAGTDALDFIWSSPSGDPNTTTWPTGTYKAQIDIQAIGADISTGFRAAGGSTGHFARVNSGLTADQGTTFQQTESLFTTTGQHTGSVVDPNWGSPAASDRFEAMLATVRASGCHGNQRVSLNLDSTLSFMEGPWSASSPQTLTVTGITSDESFGSPTVNRNVKPTGITSDESFGVPQINRNVKPTGITSDESFGSPTVKANQTLVVTGIPSVESFGNPSIAQDQTLVVTGITSDESFGNPNIAQDQVLEVVGVPSTESFGSPKLNRNVKPTGIASDESFGVPKLNLTLGVVGVASTESFGNPQLNLTIRAVGLPSDESFGLPSLVEGSKPPDFTLVGTFTPKISLTGSFEPKIKRTI